MKEKIENAKKFIMNRFEEDAEKLENLPNEKLFFSEKITEKHISNLKKAFWEIFEEIETEADIIDLLTIIKENKKVAFSMISECPYYLCPNLLNQSCKVCNRCYSAKNERFPTVLKSRLKNYFFFNLLEYFRQEDFGFYRYIGANAIHNNRKKLTEIIRINQNGDFRNQNHLEIFEDLLLIAKRLNPKTVFYSYSKANINFDGLDDDFRVNKSIIIENNEDLTEFVETNDFSDMFYLCLMSKDIEIEDFNINRCLNDCFNCRQCARYYKDKTNAKYTYLH